MALKSTIYKLNITLSDMDRNYYDTLNLTVAQHPSENDERLMIRVLAFCINAQERLSFSKGLDSPDDPDIWLHTLDNQLRLWIDVGEPAFDRIKKATRIAETVKVYSFNSKSRQWWSQVQDNYKELSAQVFQFDWKSAQALAALVQRTMDFSVTITENSAYIAAEKGECEIAWRSLH